MSVRIAFTDSIARDTGSHFSEISQDCLTTSPSLPCLIFCYQTFLSVLVSFKFNWHGITFPRKLPACLWAPPFFGDPLLHTLLTLLSYLLLSLCTECDCISQGLNCPQVPETICWQIWLAFTTLSPLVGIPDSLRNIAISQRAWGISEGREGQGQLLNLIPRQFEKSLVKAKNGLWFDTQQQVIVVASISLEA